MKWILLLTFCASCVTTALAQDAPYYPRKAEANQDLGGLNQNFQDIQTRTADKMAGTITPASCPGGAALTGAFYNHGTTYGGSCTVVSTSTVFSPSSNTFTGSNVFTSSVSLNCSTQGPYGTNVCGALYVSGQTIIVGSVTLQNNAMSVGGSTLSVGSGDVAIGTTTTNLNTFFVQSSSNYPTYSVFAMVPVNFSYLLSSGTPTSPVIVSTLSTIDQKGFFFDGSTYQTVAGMRWCISGVPAANNLPGCMELQTGTNTSNFNAKLHADAFGNFFMGPGITSSILNAGSLYGLVLSTSIQVKGDLVQTTGNMETPGTFTVGSTATVLGNAFSVGSSTFSVNGGTTSIAGGLIISSGANVGTMITGMISGTGAINFGVIAGTSCATGTVTVTNALTGDLAVLGLPSAAAISNVVYGSPWISSANTATVQACCITTVPCASIPNSIFRVDVWKH